MRWPWMSLVAHAEILAQNDAMHTRVLHAAYEVVEAAKQAAHAAERRSEDLLTKYHDLIQRRSVADKIPLASTFTPPEVDLVAAAIAEQTANDQPLARHLWAYVNTERAKARAKRPDALSEGDLLLRITDWKTVPTDEPQMPEVSQTAEAYFDADEPETPVHAST